MKNRAWHRILAFVLSLVFFASACGIGSYAYNMPSGYSFSSSYMSGKYYTQLKAVNLTGNQRTDIAAIAKSQLGYHEGSKGVYSGYGTTKDNYTEYNRYAYSSPNVAWCASFVAWCAAMAGIPTSILSGGQYDSLVHKMGKDLGAVGFAVYLDLLERFYGSSDGYDVDVLLIYGEENSPAEVFEAVSKLTKDTSSVKALARDDGNVKYKKLARLVGGEVEIIEAND